MKRFTLSLAVLFAVAACSEAGPTIPHGNTPDPMTSGELAMVADPGADRPSLKVQKTAETFLDRTWSWEITKDITSEVPEVLAEGDVLPVDFLVGLSAVSEDSGWKVEGTITVTNPSDVDAEVREVWDRIRQEGQDDLLASVVCTEEGTEVEFPYTLGAGDTLVCTYSADLPSAAPGENKAAAFVTGESEVAEGFGRAAVDFSDATVSEVGTCVDVGDVLAVNGTQVADESLGQVCLGDLDDSGEAGFTYTRSFGAADGADFQLWCGDNSVRNDATFKVVDGDEAGGTASAGFSVDVKCEPPVVDEFTGCTPGFWANTRAAWPEPFSRTDTFGEVFGGDVDPSLAHISLGNMLSLGGGPGVVGAQRILLRAAAAAVLNAANEVANYPLDVDGVIAEVQAALATGDRGEILALAAQLDEWNNLGCPLDNQLPEEGSPAPDPTPEGGDKDQQPGEVGEGDDDGKDEDNGEDDGKEPEVTLAGCSPGFWANMTGEWPSPYSRTDTFGEIFAGVHEAIADTEFGNMLRLGGGPGVLGAQRILLRAAAAALLNAANDDVNYSMSVAEVIDAVNDALAGNDRGELLALAAEMDEQNNLGCSLNNAGQPNG
ncbi:MAG: hypothetical protein EA422_12915 [Gemmatimonadales bacterium]|nr:MAG: hypothetical protein EA422_12915 [Gemmatimonadales bacterium]